MITAGKLRSRTCYLVLLAIASFAFATACGGSGKPVQRTATVAPAATAPTATPASSAETLAFLRDGDVWLIESDGNNERQLGLRGVLSFAWVSPRQIDVVARDERPMHLLVDVDGKVDELFFPGDFDVSGGLSTSHARGSWSRDRTLFVVPVEDRLVLYDQSGREVRTLAVEPPIVSADPTGFRSFCDEPDSKQANAVNVFGSPAFAADGESIFVAIFCGAYRTEADGNALGFPRNLYSRLYRVSLTSDTVEVLPISTNLRSDSRPFLSPDGSRIALPNSSYLSICDYVFGFGVAFADGSSTEDVSLSELSELFARHASTELGGGVLGGVVGFDWSPQGDVLIAAVDASACNDFMPEPGLAGLYLLKLDGAPAERLLDEPAHSPAWSPSGDVIAYVGGRYFGEPTETPTIRLLHRTTGQVTDLAQGSDPAWQPQR